MAEKRPSPRRRSSNLVSDIFAQNRSRFSRPGHVTPMRAKRASLGPTSQAAHFSSKFNESLAKISEMMLTLFIPESRLKVFVSALKSVQFCGASAIRRNTSGDVFYSEWNMFCDTVTQYLSGNHAERCRDFICENLNAFEASLKNLSTKIPLFGPLKKRMTPIYNEMKSELDDIITKASQSKTVEEISSLATLIDRFDGSLSMKYSGFFEIILSDRTERTSLLFEYSQYFQKSTNCCRKVLKASDAVATFLELLKTTSDTFALIIKPTLVRADSVSEFKRRKTMSSVFRIPLTKAKSQMKYNKTDKLEVANVAIPLRRHPKEDDSSQETAKMITVPDVSVTSDPKPVSKIAPKRTHPKQISRLDPRQEMQKLKDKHEKLKEQLSSSKILTEYGSIQEEVNQLQNRLNEHKKAEMNNDDIEQSIMILRELCNLEGERTQNLEAELMRIHQVNDGIQTENATVNFDNISLKKEISELNDDLHRKRALVEMNRMQKERMLTTNLEEDLAQQTKLLDEDIRLLRRLISWTEQRVEVISKREPEMNFELHFEDDKGLNVTKLKDKIAKLEKSLNSRRPNSWNMTISEQYDSLRTSIAMTQATVSRLQKSFDSLRNRIDKLNAQSHRITTKRQDFDTFEVLQDQARECQKQYFALKGQITPTMDCKERYKIEMSMEDVQDHYTSVMMEIERILDTTAQESLRSLRKDRNKTRKDVARMLSQAQDVMNETIEQERQAVEKEQELRVLVKTHGTVDERHVMQLSEWILEKMKTDEVLKLIDNQTQEFGIELCGASRTRKIDELKDTIAKLLKNGGPKMAQRLRIYNLTKEIERLQ